MNGNRAGMEALITAASWQARTNSKPKPSIGM